MATTTKSKPAGVFVKKAVRAGVYKQTSLDPVTDKIVTQTVYVSPQFLRKSAFGTMHMIRNGGLTVPVCLDHQDEAVPKPVQVDEWLAEEMRNSVGVLEDVKFNPETQEHEYKFSIKDPIIAEKVRNGIITTVSPNFHNEFSTGNGSRYTNVIAHLALTFRPRDFKQSKEPMREVSAVRASAPDKTGSVRFSVMSAVANTGEFLVPMHQMSFNTLKAMAKRDSTGRVSFESVDYTFKFETLGDFHKWLTRRYQWTLQMSIAGRFGHVLYFAVVHAPVGGITIGGRRYLGGQFIPTTSLESLHPEDRKRVQDASAALRQKRTEAASAHRGADETWQQAIKRHVGEHANRELSTSDRQQTIRRLNALRNHHGDQVAERIAMLAGQDAAKLAGAGDGPDAELLKRRLAAYHTMSGMLGDKDLPKPQEMKQAASKGDDVSDVLHYARDSGASGPVESRRIKHGSGVLGYTVHDDQKYKYSLNNIDVDEADRGKGIAKKMLRSFFEKAAGDNVNISARTQMGKHLEPIINRLAKEHNVALHGMSDKPSEAKASQEWKAGATEDGAAVLARVQASPNQPKDRNWDKYADNFGVSGDFDHVEIPTDTLKKHLDAGYLRGSNSVNTETVNEKAKSGDRNPVVITKEPGRNSLVVDGNHSLHAAIQAGDKSVKAIVSKNSPLHPDNQQSQGHKNALAEMADASSDVDTAIKKRMHNEMKQELMDRMKEDWPHLSDEQKADFEKKIAALPHNALGEPDENGQYPDNPNDYRAANDIIGEVNDAAYDAKRENENKAAKEKRIAEHKKDIEEAAKRGLVFERPDDHDNPGDLKVHPEKLDLAKAAVKDYQEQAKKHLEDSKNQLNKKEAARSKRMHKHLSEAAKQMQREIDAHEKAKETPDQSKSRRESEEKAAKESYDKDVGAGAYDKITGKDRASADALSKGNAVIGESVGHLPLKKAVEEAKRRYPEHTVLHRMGDFYELIGDDAVKAAKDLKLTLTTRDKDYPMAGFPHHALETNLRGLLAKGHKVAIMDGSDAARRAIEEAKQPGEMPDESPFAKEHGSKKSKVEQENEWLNKDAEHRKEFGERADKETDPIKKSVLKAQAFYRPHSDDDFDKIKSEHDSARDDVSEWSKKQNDLYSKMSNLESKYKQDTPAYKKLEEQYRDAKDKSMEAQERFKKTKIYYDDAATAKALHDPKIPDYVKYAHVQQKSWGSENPKLREAILEHAKKDAVASGLPEEAGEHLADEVSRYPRLDDHARSVKYAAGRHENAQRESGLRKDIESLPGYKDLPEHVVYNIQKNAFERHQYDPPKALEKAKEYIDEHRASVEADERYEREKKEQTQKKRDIADAIKSGKITSENIGDAVSHAIRSRHEAHTNFDPSATGKKYKESDYLVDTFKGANGSLTGIGHATIANEGYWTDGRAAVKAPQSLVDHVKSQGWGSIASPAPVRRLISSVKYGAPSKIESYDPSGDGKYFITDGKKHSAVRAEDHHRITSLYPDAVPHMPTVASKPVVYKSGGEIVGIAMQLIKSKSDNVPLDKPDLGEKVDLSSFAEPGKYKPKDMQVIYTGTNKLSVRHPDDAGVGLDVHKPSKTSDEWKVDGFHGSYNSKAQAVNAAKEILSYSHGKSGSHETGLQFKPKASNAPSSGDNAAKVSKLKGEIEKIRDKMYERSKRSRGTAGALNRDIQNWQTTLDAKRKELKELEGGVEKFSIAHAPAGGVTFDGTFYKGGEFTPLSAEQQEHNKKMSGSDEYKKKKEESIKSVNELKRRHGSDYFDKLRSIASGPDDYKGNMHSGTKPGGIMVMRSERNWKPGDVYHTEAGPVIVDSVGKPYSDASIADKARNLAVRTFMDASARPIHKGKVDVKVRMPSTDEDFDRINLALDAHNAIRAHTEGNTEAHASLVNKIFGQHKFAVIHAPAGGSDVDGHHYLGGQFTPNDEQGVTGPAYVEQAKDYSKMQNETTPEEALSFMSHEPNYAKVKKAYISKNATINPDGSIKSIPINTDDWREYIPGYVGTNAHVVHQAASGANDRMFKEALELMKGKGNKKVAILGGGGGCHGINTPIMMADGSVKMVQNIKEGDELMGPDSMPRKVLRLIRGNAPLYAVVPTKGQKFTVNGDHILSLHTITRNKVKSRRVDTKVEISVDDVLKRGKRFFDNFFLYRVPVDFNWDAPILDPYFLGLWLGDGTTGSSTITSADNEVKKYLADFVKKFPKLKLRIARKLDNKASTFHLSLRSQVQRGKWGAVKNPLMELMRAIGVLDSKYIPDDYLRNDRSVRLELLAGILDSDGSYDRRGGFDFVTKHKHFAEQVEFLARSLGFSAYAKPCTKSSQFGKKGTYYRMFICGDVNLIPTKIAHKKATPRATHYADGHRTRCVLHSGFKIEPIGMGDYFGFTLSGDGLYLLGDFTVTHNSGKGTAVGRHFDQHEYPIRVDQVSGHYDHLMDKIKQIKEAGFEPDIVFVDRSPHEAWQGVVGRAMDSHRKGQPPRTVPYDVAVKANIEARKVALRLAQENPDINLRVIDNNGEGDSRLLEDRTEIIKHLLKADHNPEEEMQKAREHVNKLESIGKLPSHIAAGLRGPRG